jgi:hypothetical protein
MVLCVVDSDSLNPDTDTNPDPAFKVDPVPDPGFDDQNIGEAFSSQKKTSST